MRYNEDDIAALEEVSAQEQEERTLDAIRRRTRAKMRAAQRLGYATDVALDRETEIVSDDE